MPVDDEEKLFPFWYFNMGNNSVAHVYATPRRDNVYYIESHGVSASLGYQLFEDKDEAYRIAIATVNNKIGELEEKLRTLKSER